MENKLIIPAKKYQGETSVVSMRLPNDMVRDLDQVAGHTGRNRNEIVLLCLEFALDNLKIENGEQS
ncbi:MAG: hypothetical protein PUK05_06390 [Peptoniphilaceae bacterium]|nr:hypothetical protein [Peptoniphilaceae bacterium]MDY5766102.1 hypothetical protein [Peptoniphilaceae bacterium]